MKAAAFKYTVLSFAATLVAIILIFVPFHAFLTVWMSSIFSHYTALRLWKEVLLLAIGGAVVYLLLTDHKIRSHTLTRRLVWLVVGYAGLQLVLAALALEADRVTLKAAAYGLLVNLRFLVFFLFVWAVALRTARLKTNWQCLLLWPAVVVIVFGLLQITILPADFLRHFGYGALTIDPFETVNSNRDYVRIASTLRGPNPLGTYLIIPLTAVLVLLLRSGRKRRLAVLLIGGLAVLVASFSRSAALGTLVSLSLVALLSIRTRQAKKYAALLVISLVVLAGLGAAAVPQNSRLENIILHTDSKSTIVVDSNDARLTALGRSSAELVAEPFGRGPGTAGPASVYNNNQVRLAENYFLQLGQEVGLLGMLLFVLICAGVGYLLWLRRSDTLALTLFASLIGITLVNLLSHAWADDTLAYVWWGLAGIAMASLPVMPTEDAKND